jgi:hypothetical protein
MRKLKLPDSELGFFLSRLLLTPPFLQLANSATASLKQTEESRRRSILRASNENKISHRWRNKRKLEWKRFRKLKRVLPNVVKHVYTENP